MTSKHDKGGDIPVEFLNSLHYPGYPKHQLRLKKNMILMLMQNMNKNKGFAMEHASY